MTEVKAHIMVLPGTYRGFVGSEPLRLTATVFQEIHFEKGIERPKRKAQNEWKVEAGVPNQLFILSPNHLMSFMTIKGK